MTIAANEAEETFIRPWQVEPTANGVSTGWKKWGRLALLMIVFAGLGGVGGYFLGESALVDNVLRQVPWWVLIPAFFLGAFLATLGHELGHVAAGRVVGFRFLLLVVGPLRLARAGERLSLSLNQNLALIGGMAASVPASSDNLRQRRAWQVAGGPLASLLLALIGMGTGPWIATAVPLLGVFFVVTGLVAAMQVVATLLPLKSGGLRSDGGQLLQLAQDTPEARLQMMVIWLQADLMAGTRPRNLDDVLMKQALSIPDEGVMGISARMIGYYHALDHDDVEGARLLLLAALEGYQAYPQAFRPSLAAEAAYFAGRHLGTAVAAREWLALAQGTFVEAHVQGRAEAAVLLAEGRVDEARAAAGAALAEMGTAQDRGTAVAEREWLLAMQAWPDNAT